MRRRLCRDCFRSILVLAVLLGPACGRAPDSAPAGGSGLPGLPQVAGAAKLRRSSWDSFILAGAQYSEASGGVVIEDDRLRLDSLPGSLEYAIYEFPLEPGDAPVKLACCTEDHSWMFGKVWIALANYANGYWEILPPNTEDTITIEMENPDDYLGPGGHLYCALLCWQGDGYAICSLELWLTNRPDEIHPWPSLGGGRAGTRSSTAACVTETNLHRKALLTPQFIQSAPAIAQDGTLYVGTRDFSDLGILYALNPDLTVKWQVNLPGFINAAPALGPDGAVYVGCTDRRLYCFNRNGCLRWSFLTGDEVHSSPVVAADGTVYFGSKDFNFYALSPDGSLAWAFPADSAVYSGPALGPDGRLYFASALGTLYAVDAGGGEVWAYPCTGTVYGGIALGADGTVYCATTAGMLFAVNPNGSLRGSSAPEGEFRAGPCLANGSVYLGNLNGSFYRFGPAGDWLNTVDAGAAVYATAAADAAGNLFFGTEAGEFTALTADLSPLWSYNAKEKLRSSPGIAAAGGLYVGGMEGRFFEFAPNAPLPPATPAGLSASDGTQAGKIVLTWDESLDANGYLVYKDGDLSPVASLGYVQSWVDEVADTDPHEYTLVATNEFGDSPASQPDTGFAGAPQLSLWAQYRGNPARTNCAPVAGPAVEPTSDTQIDLGFGHSATPAAFGIDGTLYFKDVQGKLLSYDGGLSLNWDYPIPDPASLSPAVGIDGNNYIGRDGKLEAVTPLGAFAWDYPATPVDGMEVAGLDNAGRIYCLAYSDGYLRCVNPDGSEAWAYYTGHKNYYTLVAIGSDGSVYFGDDTQGVVKLNPAGGFAWLYPDNTARRQCPAVVPDPVNGDRILLAGDNGVTCLDPTGGVLWTAKDASANNIYGLPTAAPNGTIFTYDGAYLFALEADGTERNRVEPGGSTSASGLVVDPDSNVYVATGTGFESYDDQLSLRWAYSTLKNFAQSVPVIGPDGRLYANDNQQSLHVIE